jgi:hypothetical protein
MGLTQRGPLDIADRMNVGIQGCRGRVAGVILFCLVFVLGLAACQDKTLDDWRREKVNRELNELRSVSGDYVGSLVSAKDGQALGSVLLNLAPDAQPQASADGTTTEQQAALKGRLKFYGTQRADLHFEKGFFDSSSKSFQGVITVPDSAGGTTTMEISGSISGGSVTGVLEARGFPEDGAHFELSKSYGNADSQLLASAPPVGAAIPPLMTFKAQDPYRARSGDATDIQMSLQYRRTTSEQSFVDYFVPTQEAQVTFSFWNGQMNIPFSHARYDERTGILIGETVVSDGGMSFVVNVDCHLEPTDSGQGWSCRLISAAKGLIFDTLFTPTENAGASGYL